MINNIRKITVLLMISSFLFSYCGCSKPTSETHGEINSYSVSKAGEITPNDIVVQLDDLFTESTEEAISSEEQETLSVPSTVSVEASVSEPTEEIHTESNEEGTSPTTGEDDVLATGETTQIVTDSPSPSIFPVATNSPKPTNRPAATSTPKPTNRPVATSTPKPTNRPAATSTPKPTNRPVATSTPKPTNKPAATSAPKPTNKPVATSTTKPTNKPAATSTPKPTSQPTATSTPKPTNTPTPKPTSKPKPPVETTKDTSDYGTCWITERGKRYHSTSTCSGMKDPIQTSIGNAKDLGYSACGKCW